MGQAFGDSPEITQASCHECGQRYQHQSIAPGAVARCMRCGTALYRNRKLSFDNALAYTIAAVILFVVANLFPFLGFGFPGEIRHTTLITGSLQLYQQGEVLLALIVLFTSVIAPAIQLLLLLYLLIPVNLGYNPRGIPSVLKLTLRIRYWSMMDVFLLGILVSAVKLSDMATIVVGPALLAFLTLIFMLAAAQAAFDSQRLWSMVKLPNKSKLTGMADKLAECHVCQLAVPMADKPLKSLDCPRCLTPLHYRKPNSLQRTWALVLAAFVCYVPANLLPIMKTSSVAGTQFDTIMSGIIYLISHGSWPVGLVVLIASVIVPLLKIAILIFLLISIQVRCKWRPKERTQLYRWAELVGKWSMVDIFVVNTLVALVQMGSLVSIEAGAGALFFCAVVVLTMFAAMSFDPRLIWDKLENNNDSVSAKYA